MDCRYCKYSSVSIHAPTKGATRHPVHRRNAQLCFNPRSYERSDDLPEKLPDEIIVSIHAPTKGATVLESTCDSASRVSIHAPTKGATHRR